MSRTFVALADTFDEDGQAERLELLVTRGSELLDMTDAGIVLSDDVGHLHVEAFSSPRVQRIELMEVRVGDGPCFESIRTGSIAGAHHLEDTADRWPIFSVAALESGYRSVYAFPLRTGDVRIGSVSLFADHPGGLDEADQSVAQAMADIAAVGIMHERSLRAHQVQADQLQNALDSRVVIEQAKGIISAQRSTSVDDAFQALRGYSRNTNTPLTEVAGRVVAGSLVHTDLPVTSPVRPAGASRVGHRVTRPSPRSVQPNR